MDFYKKQPSTTENMRSARLRSGTAGATVIEVSIPLRTLQSEGDDADEACYICANAFCASDACRRSLTHLACCTQAICCGCLSKTCKRCGCKDDCDAVIALCPFCREVSPVEVLDVFLGAKDPCAECSKRDAAPLLDAPPHAPPPDDGEA